ncbi:putative multiple inositol polyphosphate histidine phosphatase 1 [Prevotella sp. CAG:732]|nr:putative multiple inositol polyphosphate histidine phosphatase 1 [Prevotella sp. CAG:732]
MNLFKKQLWLFATALLATSALMSASTIQAQTPREDFKRDITLSASNYVAYRGPQKQLSPAPKGYKPFYLSHYGRHGSRYMIGKAAYDVPYFSLLKAKQEGKLTPKGEETLRKVALIRENAKGRDGELTPLGALQHQGITQRMMERFPEIFAGKTNVEARSTVVIRCILSMENGLQAMLRKNPQLHIFHDASYHDMYYMNQGDKRLDSLKNCIGRKTVQEEFTKKHDCYDRVMKELFNDPAWVKQNINPRDLNWKLFEMAGAIQGTELRGKVSLYDLFNEEEIYQNWVVSNSWWQMSYGYSPYTGNEQPYSQRNLLRDIIEKADSCIALAHPGATLRYGHDTMVTPLVCLLNLNGYGEEIKEPEKIATQWFDYKITPMATNLQFVFYRKAKSDDILVKVLLNEDEATLPIQSDVAPYYHWNDFKAYCQEKLASFNDI